MEKKTKTVVKIGGREYAMRGFESKEYIHKVAIYVDRKIEKIAERQPSLSTSMIAILTAINLADEVIKLQEEVEKLQNQLKAVQESKKSSTPAIYEVHRKGRK